MLDTPGILWPKFEDQSVGLRLAFIGSIKDELNNMYELSILLCEYIMEHYPQSIPSYYEVEACEEASQMLEQIAQRRGCLKQGGILDVDQAARYLLDDFRNGRLGKISLEEPVEA